MYDLYHIIFANCHDKQRKKQHILCKRIQHDLSKTHSRLDATRDPVSFRFPQKTILLREKKE